MRQIWVMVPTGSGEKVIEKVATLETENVFQMQGSDRDRRLDIVVLNVANQTVSQVIQCLDGLEDMKVILQPQDVYPLTPDQDISQHITNVTPRSPEEIWLNGLQSIGGWKSFLGYTLGASVVVWIGLFTNTIYLLVAAMLIAPFAGPAMNLALATATGDSVMVRRNVIRYGVSIVTAIAISAVLSLLVRQTAVTNLMTQISAVSSFALLLPLVAGAVGALNLTQASNSSLVPGTAVGTLVAASLAPPAGLVGMAAAQQRWDMAINGVFLLLLQLVAINLSGGLVFRAFHMKPGSTHFSRGKGAVFYVSTGMSLLAISLLLTWQFWESPNLQRSTREQQINETVQQIVRDYPHADLVDVQLRFPRPSIMNQNFLLGEISVVRSANSDLATEVIEQELKSSVQQRVTKSFHVQPFFSVIVFQSHDQ
jgi:uncharacterized membrane protein